jgi:effector-binding domain-containing protein
MNMSIVSTIGLYEQAQQHILSICTTIPFSEYPQTAGQTYAKIMAFAQQNGLLFSGGPFVCYHNADLAALDVEMGFPLARPVNGNAVILGRTLPQRKVVSGIFLGAYEESDPLMMGILQWIGEHGLEQQGEIWNYYLNDEDRPKSELLTRIDVPVR